MNACKVEGCEGEICAKGYCAKHYRRQLKRGTPHIVDPYGKPQRVKDMTLQEKIAHYSETIPETSCIWWLGALNETKYAKIMWGKKCLRVHRAVYELEHGPIPEGMVVMHTCDNRECVNIDHLRLGTQKDNIHDMISKGRARYRGKSLGG